MSDVRPKKLGGRLLEIPLTVLATPREGEVKLDRWWVVRDGRGHTLSADLLVAGTRIGEEES